jgi:hypothetical protein
MVVPSMLKATEFTVDESVSVALIVTLPETVEPEVGLVIESVGAETPKPPAAATETLPRTYQPPDA